MPSAPPRAVSPSQLKPSLGWLPGQPGILGETSAPIVFVSCRWRTKQNLDYCFLMMYAQSKGIYYVQVGLVLGAEGSWVYLRVHGGLYPAERGLRACPVV